MLLAKCHLSKGELSPCGPALLFAREQGLKDVLLNVAALTGFSSPNLGQRHFFIQKWAEAAGLVRVAIVARPEIIDVRRFGITVAENLG